MFQIHWALSWIFIPLVIPSTLCITNNCKEDRQASLDTWDKFNLAPGEQDVVAVGIPAGHLQTLTKQIENNLLENSSLSESAFSWRITVFIEGATADEPILVLAKDGKSERSFKMPHTHIKDRSKVEITVPFSNRSVHLCPVEQMSQDSVLSIAVFSLSNSTVEVNLKAELTSPRLDWKKRGEKEFETVGTLSLSSPIVKKSLFSPYVVNSDESILITVESVGSDCFCSLVSVQQPNCPYFDDVSSAIRFGIWQTMLNKTALQIQQRDFPNGYIIIIVAAESDDFCQIANENNKCENRTDYLEKRIKIKESVNTFSETTLTALFVIIGIYAVIIIFSLSLSIVCFKKIENIKDEVDMKKVSNNDEKGCLSAFVNPERGETDKEEPNHESEDTLYVSDLNKKLHEPNKSKSNYQKSTLFMGNLLLMSIFYSLAVLQLAFQSAAKQTSSGNNDICYFNNLCQKPWGPFLDFNHFFSNLGYIVFGLVFILIVYIKQTKFDERENTRIKYFGIPHQYGIYYTMGGALAMEGFMSACYHVCPTTISFQFDTTFMYLLAILMYIKLYQNRHPDTSCNSIQAFLILGAALILEAISIYYSSGTFWVIFCVIYFFFILILAANIFNIENKERARQDNKFIFRVIWMSFVEIKNLFVKMKEKKNYRVRHLLAFLTVTWIINCLLCVYNAANASSNKSGASNYLLVMFMANMFVYLLYYVIMKYISKEQLKGRTWFYAICSVACALPAMWFFVQKAKNSELSPAESRDINTRVCFWIILMGMMSGTSWVVQVSSSLSCSYSR